MDFGDRPISNGTTVLALTYEGGVLLATDTRTSQGVYISNRAAEKLTSITSHVVSGQAGARAVSLAMISQLQHVMYQQQAESQRTATVSSVARIAQLLSYNNKDRVSAFSLVIAGWDEVAGPQIFALPIGGTLVRVPYAATGSGGTYITAFLERFWREGMAWEECRELVLKAMGLAIGYDSSSGGGVRLVRVDKDGQAKEVIDEKNVPLPPNAKGQPVVRAAA